MSREILVNYKGILSSFTLDRVERNRLYGERKRRVLDPSHKPCMRAELVEEGDVILSPGMTTTAHLDSEGNFFAQGTLVGITEDGKAVSKVPSTLNAAQDLVGPIPSTEALDVMVSAVYALTPEKLDVELFEALNKGAIFRFPFNYRTDYHASVALLVANEHGVFALVGEQVSPQWCGPDSPPPSQIQDEIEEDLDFEMF